MDKNIVAKALASLDSAAKWEPGRGERQLTVGIMQSAQMKFTLYWHEDNLLPLSDEDRASGWYSPHLRGGSGMFSRLLTIVEIGDGDYLERYRAYFRQYEMRLGEYALGGYGGHIYEFLYGQRNERNKGDPNPAHRGKPTAVEEFFDPTSFFERLEKEYGVDINTLHAIFSQGFKEEIIKIEEKEYD